MSQFVPGSGFLARTASDLHAAARKTFYADEFAHTPGFLQSLDPRSKIVGLGAMVLAASSTRHPEALAAMLVFGLLLAIASRIPLKVLAARAWAGIFLLTFVLAGPAMFTTPGNPIIQLPFGIQITDHGLKTAALLILRVETAATFPALLILSTPWMHVLKALRVLRVPVALVVILALTCRYIVLLLQTAQDMFEARESRRIGILSTKQQRQMATSSVGVLFTKTLVLSEEVYLAMRARGYNGDVFLLQTFRMRPRDWAVAIAMPAGAFLPLLLK
ncbi:MAG TPA: cobalt ECF transporter T component CbiQ [Bryobacteraceae bacterium]|nr:cobalt ECF transporter T component CbiQ [Bryobacteraceae bacterium]